MRYALNGVEGVEWFGIISLLIFFTFFVGVSIWAIRADKGFVQYMKNLPLDEQNNLESKKLDL